MRKSNLLLDASPEEYKHRVKLIMAWRISAFFVLMFILLMIFVGNHINSIYSYASAILLGTFGLLYLYFKRNPDPIFIVYAIIGSAICQYSCWFVPQNSHYGNFVWVAICSFVPVFANAKRVNIILLVLNSLGVGYYIFFQHNACISSLNLATEEELIATYLELLLSFFVIGYITYQFIVFNEVSESAYKESARKLQEQNEIVEKKNSENITLLKEIHHRVKNNLQIIVSLLRLQKHELIHEESKEQFQEAINRVMVMSSVHKKLYLEEKLTEIDLEQYLSELIDELVLLYDSNSKINVALTTEIESLDLKTMIPVGLLINELISNSFKYAFIESSHGTIEISIKQQNAGFTMSYKDNGTWQDNESASGFGLELIDIFTDQLNGTREFKTDETGTTYFFTLKLAES